MYLMIFFAFITIQDVTPELQESAQSLLVALAAISPKTVIDELLARFEPGVVPHYFILKAFGEVAAAEPMTVVPLLKGVLSRVIPILGSIKHDHVKWAVATIIWQFCEAIQMYVANIEKGAGQSLTLTSFSSEMYPAYEVLFSKWVSSSEKKLKVSVIKAIGVCTWVFTTEQYDREVVKIVPLFLKLLKGEREYPLPMTQGLCSVIEVGVKLHSAALTPDLILAIENALIPYVCEIPDYTQPNTLKNYNESLRCFETLARGNAEAVLSFLLKRLELRDVAGKCGALAIFKHLVNSVSDKLEDKKGIVVSGVRPLIINETNFVVLFIYLFIYLFIC